MSDKKEYKPILVLYIDEGMDMDTRGQLIHDMKEKGLRYHVLLFPVDENPRAEIISVDKATVVEDIQKYINDGKKE